MNWKLILLLSPVGVALGAASLVGFAGDLHGVYWSGAGVLCALAIARQLPDRHFRNGIGVGLVGGTMALLLPALFFDEYARRNPATVVNLNAVLEEEAISARMALFIAALPVGLASGVILGVMSALFAKALRPEEPKRRADAWVLLVLAFVVLQWGCLLVPYARPGLAGAICWMIGPDYTLWGGAALFVLIWALAWSAWRRPFLSRWRAVGYLALGLLVLTPFLWQGRAYPSSHDNSPSQVRFRLPLDGPVTVGWGGGTPGQNYHVAYADQRWAYDLLVTRDGKSFHGDGKKVTDYYCYGLPVLAPADGVVQATFDGDPDMPVGELGGGTNAGGNQVVLQVAPHEFVWICHLQRGSLAVKPGDRVTAGQVLARVGNSGNTSEPHIHIHLQDTAADGFGEGIPLHFHDYLCNGERVERGLPTGGATGRRFTGQIVEHIRSDTAH